MATSTISYYRALSSLVLSFFLALSIAMAICIFFPLAPAERMFIGALSMPFSWPAIMTYFITRAQLNRVLAPSLAITLVLSALVANHLIGAVG